MTAWPSVFGVLGLLLSTNPQPPSRAELQGAITRLGIGQPPEFSDPELTLLSRSPSLAAQLLIEQLTVIDPPPPAISGIEDRRSESDRQALHVVWCIRALRYITGGLDFRAPTDHRFSATEEFREQWLRKRATDSTVPFFSTRMTTDTVYIAPLDAQQKIIQRWKDWYSQSGSRLEFRDPPALNDWYF